MTFFKCHCCGTNPFLLHAYECMVEAKKKLFREKNGEAKAFTRELIAGYRNDIRFYLEDVAMKYQLRRHLRSLALMESRAGAH